MLKTQGKLNVAKMNYNCRVYCLYSASSLLNIQLLLMNHKIVFTAFQVPNRRVVAAWLVTVDTEGVGNGE